MVISDATSPHQSLHGDRSTQYGLAASLIECMGRDSAIHVCQVNGWDGVLEVLLEDAPASGLHERH